MEESKPQHILRPFEDAMNALRDHVLVMASLTGRNLSNAMTGLFKRDTDSCNLVIAEDEEIDAFEKSVDGDGIEIIVRFQPVALDIRQVIAAMRLSSNLERIADQAVNIARIARKLNQEPELPELQVLQPMFHDVDEMYKDSMKAYGDGDTETALQLKPRDKKIDAINRQIAEQLTKRMEEDRNRIQGYLSIIFIARCLERVADHVTNIGEDVVYAVAAEDVRHVSAKELSQKEV